MKKIEEHTFCASITFVTAFLKDNFFFRIVNIYYCHSLALDHLRRRHDRQIRYVDQRVAKGDERYADHDGPGQILGRVLDLLGHVVEIVPAVVGPEAGVESGGEAADVDGAAVDTVERRLQMLRVTLYQFVRTAGNHHEYRHQLGGGEGVLHTGGQIDAVTIDQEYQDDRQQGDDLDHLIRWVAIEGERFDGILGERQADDCHLRRLEHQGGYPGEEEGRRRAERVHEVRVFGTAARIHGAQLGVGEGAAQAQETACGPHDETDADATGTQQQTRRRHEDPGADHRADD